MDKFLGPVSAEEKPVSILEWAAVYYQIKVAGAPEKTEADIPDLVSCSAFGDTSFEALEEVEVAKRLWLELAQIEGKPIPVPKYWRLIYQSLLT